MVKTVSENLAVVLQQLVELYLVYWALEKRGDLLMVSLMLLSLSSLLHNIRMYES